MQKGLDRIGLGDVEWKTFFDWFGQWVPHLVIGLLGAVVITNTEGGSADTAGV